MKTDTGYGTVFGVNARKINVISAVVLLIGLGGALIVYFLAAPEVDDLLTGQPLHSKAYVHQLGVIGGKQSVAMAEMVEWFESLWHGQALAVTLAVLTVIATLGFRFVALRPDLYAPFEEPVKKPSP